MNEGVRVKFKQLMDKAKIDTYGDLAIKSGVNDQTIRRILDGTTNPNTKNVVKLAEALNMSPGDLLNLILDTFPNNDTPLPESLQAETELHFSNLITSHCDVFAGREQELTAIEQCIVKPGAGYIFVEGDSGFGKTALLCQLTKRYENVVYHFFNQALEGTSQIFDPNREQDFLINLCRQLIKKVGKKYPLSVQDLRSTYLSLLNLPSKDATPTILLIDALDEIDLTHNFLMGLFPRKLINNTYIILSARTMGAGSYLRYTGLSSGDLAATIQLEGFDRGGIRALLKKAGGNALTYVDNGRFVDSLYKTTEGDPFYLRFLVDDIRDGHIKISNVDDIPQGLYEYLDKQFEMLSQRLESQQQYDIMGYILHGEGPISREDLIESVEGLTGFNFENTIRGIRRFLLEYDGEFTICHNRFKQYFIDRAGA